MTERDDGAMESSSRPPAASTQAERAAGRSRKKRQLFLFSLQKQNEPGILHSIFYKLYACLRRLHVSIYILPGICLRGARMEEFRVHTKTSLK